jgi:hypothetical protein
MFNALVQTHSILRYLVLIALVIVIIMALTGIMNKRPFTKLDNRFSLFLLIFTHLQLLIGLALYFVSPSVRFESGTMKDKDLRYWAVEHITAMIIAVILITVARTTSKRMITDLAKHKRLFTFNLFALIIIIGILSSKGILFTGRY